MYVYAAGRLRRLATLGGAYSIIKFNLLLYYSIILLGYNIIRILYYNIIRIYLIHVLLSLSYY